MTGRQMHEAGRYRVVEVVEPSPLSRWDTRYRVIRQDGTFVGGCSPLSVAIARAERQAKWDRELSIGREIIAWKEAQR